MILYVAIVDVVDGVGNECKCQAAEEKQHHELRLMFLKKLKELIHPRYAKEMQEQQRTIITSKMSYTVTLSRDVLFASIDFIANMASNAKIATHSSQITPLQQQLCVIYDVTLAENPVDERVYCFHSNRTKHDWYSAILIWQKWIQQQKVDFPARGVAM